MSITNKQKRFCEEFLVDLNATQAAIRAGYSYKTARQIAAQNLSKLYIQDHLKELRGRQQERTQITADSVVKELALIGFAEIGENIKASDKNKSLELLGKHLGMFTQKIEAEVSNINKKQEIRAMFDSMTVEQKMQWLKDNS